MGKIFKRPSFGHKSYDSALNGIINYTFNNDNSIFKGLDGNQRRKKVGLIMKGFLRYMKIEHRIKGNEKDLRYNANLVQNNFKEYKKYLKDLE